MASKYLQNYPIPEGFYETLHDFAREVIRDQPEDIILYATNYFESRLNGKHFLYDSKYNIKRTDQKHPKEYHPEDQRKFNKDRIASASSNAASNKTEKEAAKMYVSGLMEKSLRSDRLPNDDESDILNENDSNLISGEIYIKIIEANGLAVDDMNANTFCVAFLSNKPNKIVKTPTCHIAKDPKWNFLDKLVVQFDREEVFDLQLIIQIFNDENVGRMLVGESIFEAMQLFENSGEDQSYTLKLRNSEGEEGDFGEAIIELKWVPTGFYE